MERRWGKALGAQCLAEQRGRVGKEIGQCHQSQIFSTLEKNKNKIILRKTSPFTKVDIQSQSNGRDQMGNSEYVFFYIANVTIMCCGHTY